MNINTAAILRGGALAKWRGASFYHRGAIALPIARESIDIDDIEPFGVTFRSHDRPNLEMTLPPSGRSSEAANLINRYATAKRGDLINIEEWPATLTPATDLVTIPSGNLLSTGDEVMIHWLVTAPGGLSRTTRYYWRSASGTTGTLYASAAQALDTGSTTGLVDITSAGVGVVLSAARPLILHFRSGVKITYYNSGLISIPALRFQAGETLLGEAGFRFFVRQGQDPAAMADAYYKVEYEAFADTSFDPDELPRESPIVTWEKGVPWSEGLATREGVEVAFDLATSPIGTDAFGEEALGAIYTGLDLTVTAAVQGVTEAEAHEALHINSAKRGENIVGDGALDVDTESHNFHVPAAALWEAPQQASSTEQRSSDFVWRPVPTFAAGVLNPLYTFSAN